MVLTKFCHSYDDNVCILKANCLKLKEVAKTKSKILKHTQYPILVYTKIKISSVTKTTLENTHNLYTCITIVI